MKTAQANRNRQPAPMVQPHTSSELAPHESSNDIAFKPRSLKQKSLSSLNTLNGSSVKRSADNPENELNKRAKPENCPTLISRPSTTWIPIRTNSFPSPPFTPTVDGTGASASSTEHTAHLPLGDTLESTSQETAHIAHDQIAGPCISSDAIETVQRVSADLIKGLVDKGAVDRERRLLVAVGTLRTCLDVEFTPRLVSWKKDPTLGNKAAQSTPSFDPAAATIERHPTLELAVPIAPPSQPGTFLLASLLYNLIR
jgi:hypothetical protein